MEGKCQNSDIDVKYLIGQLNTARKEINNLRQQMKSLRFVHDKEVESIKRLLGSCGSLSVDKNLSSPLNSDPVKTVQPSTSGNDSGDECLKLKPIGVVSTWFPSKRGTPRQPGVCNKAPGRLTLFNSVFTNPEHALEGLQDFSHMWILFHFHRNDSTHVRAKVAPPRLNGARTGVFSTRSPHRPCPIGLSLVKIVKIENCAIYFEGVDMVDQTPVLDVKPYIPQYDNPFYLIGKGGFMLANRDGTEENFDERINNSDFEFNERLTNQCSTDSEIGNNGMRSMSEGITEGAAHGTDISRDEEIALRLQAEEFDVNGEFGNYLETRNYYGRNFDTVVTGFDNTTTLRSVAQNSTTGNMENCRDLSIGLNSNLSLYNNDRESTTTTTTTTTITTNSDDAGRISTVTESVLLNPRNGAGNISVSRRTGESFQEDNATLYSLQNVDENSQGNRTITFNSRNIEANNPGDEISRNTRLLDGADGPSTYIDLIHRRAVNPRLDNSPIRMGVREAPDGEEGFASQTLSQIQQNVTSSGLSQNLHHQAQVNSQNIVRAENRSQINFSQEDNSADVRIPDWISRPRVSALTVTFNERALVQLNEILGDKADQQKNAIENVLCQDPRSVYLRQRWANQFYTFLIHELHISCRFDDNRHIVTVFQIRHAGRMCECGEPEWQCLGHSPLT